MEQVLPDKKFKYQLDIKQGDTVRLMAISTVDDWHNIRHSLLNQLYTVGDSPSQSQSDGIYNYRNWVRVTLNPINKNGIPIEIRDRSSFYFAKAQLKKIRSIIPIALSEKTKKMLSDINAELDNRALKKGIKMADISMCNSKTCRLRTKCYRATAPRSEYQSMILTEDDTDKRPCEYFWNNKGYRNDE